MEMVLWGINGLWFEDEVLEVLVLGVWGNMFWTRLKPVRRPEATKSAV
jgi:hypothetical protein